MALNVRTIPAALRCRRQWVGWRYEQRPEQTKAAKVPIDARTGRHASTSNPSTWSAISTVMSQLTRGTVGLEGLGYVFSDDHIGVDLDNAVDAGGKLKPWAEEILGEVPGYAERSPSGTGIHIICSGALPEGWTGTKRAWHDGAVEIYSRGRFFTMTGDVLEGFAHVTEIPNCSTQVAGLYRRIGGPAADKGSRPSVTTPTPTDISDSMILEAAFSARNGDKFRTLWEGDASGYPSASEADQALVNHLAFYAGNDPVRIDALFRQSGLMREKWDRDDYRGRTIDTAIRITRETWTPPRSAAQRTPPVTFEGDKEAMFQATTPESPEQSPDQPNDEEAELVRLAALSTIEYERERKPAAERLNWRVSVLDEVVSAMRPQRDRDGNTAGAQGQAILLAEPEPWPEPVDGAELAEGLIRTLRRYVVLPESAAIAVVFWVFMTWTLDAAQVAPRLLIRSPTRTCGKTRLMSVLKRLIRKPLPSSNITPSALFRAIEQWGPALLIDEADTFLASSDELRGIVNSGHTRDTAFVIRNVGDDYEPKSFSTWAAIAIAMIRKRLHDTLLSRSIMIDLVRKSRTEQVDRLPVAGAPFPDLTAKLCRWSSDHMEDLRRTSPSVPAELFNRDEDNWMPLLAIAECIGGEWPDRLRQAAVTLVGSGDEDQEAAGVQLLEDLRELFRDRGDRLLSAAIVQSLAEQEERPWPEWKNGKPITTRQIANLLKPYGIRPGTVRVDGVTGKGYKLEQFSEAFVRFLSPCDEDSGDRSVTTSQPMLGKGFSNFANVTSDPDVTDRNPVKSLHISNVSDVTDENGGIGEERL